jgi:hypothetical protein
MKLGQRPLRLLFSLEHSRVAYLADFVCSRFDVGISAPPAAD